MGCALPSDPIIGKLGHVTAKILDGRALAADMFQKIHQARQALGQKPIRLVSMEVGENPAASVYLRNQQRGADKVGIELSTEMLPESTSEEALVQRLRRLNDDDTVTGMLIQRPLPEHIDARRIQHAISRHKDVEGMSPSNLGAILYREPVMPPCTAAAALELIRRTDVDLRGAETVVVGHSEIVGKPIAILLLHHLATVTVCHVGTKNLLDHTKNADILVVAVGKAGLIHHEMIKPGAVVIDVGINMLDGKVVGDVDHDSAIERAGWLSPVPGGVGPVTVAMLMRNTLRAAGAEI